MVAQTHSILCGSLQWIVKVFYVFSYNIMEYWINENVWLLTEPFREQLVVWRKTFSVYLRKTKTLNFYQWFYKQRLPKTVYKLDTYKLFNLDISVQHAWTRQVNFCFQIRIFIMLLQIYGVIIMFYTYFYIFENTYKYDVIKLHKVPSERNERV